MSEEQLVISIPNARFTLPLWRKLSFSLGGFSLGLIRSVLGLFQFAFLLEVVQADVRWVGFILIVEQVVDAFGDIFIGFLSDNFPTRFGRRKPWIYAMCIPAAIFWVLSWLAPGNFHNRTGLQVVYYLFVYIMFSFSMSCVFIPYQAIIPDIAPNPLQRSIIVVIWQMYFLTGAAISSYFWSSSILWFPVQDDDKYDEGMPENYRLGYAVASVVVSVVFLVSIITGAFTVRERREFHIRDSVLESLKKSWTVINFLPFTVLCFVQAFSMFSISLYLANIYLFAKYVLERENDANYFLLTLMVCYFGVWMSTNGYEQGTTVFSLLLWLYASTKVSKIGLYIVGSFSGLFVLLTFFFMENSWPLIAIYVVYAARGFFAAASYLFPLSILPDVIEYYYGIYRDRREATFYSVINFVEKMGIMGAFLVSSVVLGLTDYKNPMTVYEEHDTQPQSAVEALQYLVSVCPMVLSFFAFSFAIVYYFKVQRRRKRYEEPVNELFLSE